MAVLKVTEFSAFFSELWGQTPFTWQCTLAERVLESLSQNTSKDIWPEAISLATGSGKTACLDIAVFALAAQAQRLAQQQTVTAPRRIFFIVDRRIIVDDAYERASHISKKLKNAKRGILKKVADNLRRISHGEPTGFKDVLPLAAYKLRGGMYRSEAWARNPLQPIIVASTVDQIGSRLLFRAYGRSFRTWSVYAGLIANDSLVFLDEAHCAQPFLQTLKAVQNFQNWGISSLNRSFCPVVISATPPRGVIPFVDSSDERLNPNHPLGQRQLVSKQTILKEVRISSERQSSDILAKTLVKMAQSLVSEQRRAIVIFANRVATARATYRRLLEENNAETILLTGRMRPLDKDYAISKQLCLLSSDCSESRQLNNPIFVVATQTLEIGADLDFDGLVTECASLDSLRQRFGRLNRMGRGRPFQARAVIVIRSDQVNGKKFDPVYGQAISKTAKWLKDHEGTNNEIDFGISHLAKILPEAESIINYNKPTNMAPVMLPAHVDCWAQTAPEPYPSPDVAPFLHGSQKSVADVQVCWRADLDLVNAKDAALETLYLCPPSSSETLPVPLGVFKQWLSGNNVSVDQSADVERVEEEADVDDELVRTEEYSVIRWCGMETNQKNITWRPANIRPGEIIVIPVKHPGLWQDLGDIPQNFAKPIASLDVGDQAYRLTRAKPILRLHPQLVEIWPDSIAAIRDPIAGFLEGLERKYEEDPDGFVDTLWDFLAKLSEVSLSGRWHWLPKVAREISEEYSYKRLHHAFHIVGKDSLILIGCRRLSKLADQADSFSDEDDINSSGISHRNGQPVRLQKHLRGVETFARRHALGCGLPKDLVDAIAKAGLLHDIGKADPRFQSLLRGGAPWLGGDAFAKSSRMPRTQSARDRANAKSKYPKGGRHELLSVRMAESIPKFLPEKNYLRDLVLHLVASHHGHCRPFAPVVNDEQGENVSFSMGSQDMTWSWAGPTGLEHLDSGVADRYWQLTRRYGWWGLAWLEALLRLADWQRSEWEERHDESE